MKKKGGNWTIKRLRECSDEEEIPAPLYNIRKRIKREEMDVYDIDKDDDDKKVEIYFIYGPSGSGKSKFIAKRILKENKNKFNSSKYNKVSYKNTYWHRVNSDVKMCIYDEFRDTHMVPDEFIQFIDYSRNTMNTKFGNEINNYELIIVTSIQTPWELWKNYTAKNGYESYIQWFRRINIIDTYPPYVNSIDKKKTEEFKSYKNYYEDCRDWIKENNYKLPKEYIDYEELIKNR